VIVSQNKSKKGTKVSEGIFLAKNPKNEITENTFFNYRCQNAHTQKDLSQVPVIIFAAGYDPYLRIYFF